MQERGSMHRALPTLLVCEQCLHTTLLSFIVISISDMHSKDNRMIHLFVVSFQSFVFFFFFLRHSTFFSYDLLTIFDDVSFIIIVDVMN
jgi:hypothetical protein